MAHELEEAVLPYNGSSGHWQDKASVRRSSRNDHNGTTLRREQTALREVMEANIRGITAREICTKLDLEKNSVAPYLTALNKEGVIVRLTKLRDGHHVYVMPEKVMGREQQKFVRRTGYDQGFSDGYQQALLDMKED